MSLADNIRIARENKGLSQDDLADLIEVSQQTIGKIEKGIIKNPRNIKKIASALDVSIDWLLTGGNSQPHSIGVYSETKPVRDFVSMIPVLSITLAARWNQLTMEEKTKMSVSLIPIKGAANAGCITIRLDSESMFNPATVSFEKGCYVTYNPEKKAANGDFVVVSVGDPEDLIVRQLIMEGGVKMLKPLNPQFPCINMPDTCLIHGVVVLKLYPFASDII